MTGVRVVLVKPGDTLVFGNAGVLDPEAVEAVSGVLDRLRELLDLKLVVMFEADIDMAAVEGGA